MSKPKTDLTAERVRELLNYDPETGVFTWRVSRRATARPGSVAGTIKANGYRVIYIGGNYMAHRLAWLYVYGTWPADDIDHINQIKGDNRIANLRQATHAQNMQNRHRHSHNSSGFRGVYLDKTRGKWRAKITANGKRTYFGPFNTPEEAYAAYCAAAARLQTHNPAANDSHRSAA